MFLKKGPKTALRKIKLEKNYTELDYLAETVYLDPLGVTDEVFGTVIGPQQVTVWFLPGSRGRHTQQCNK